MNRAATMILALALVATGACSGQAGGAGDTASAATGNNAAAAPAPNRAHSASEEVEVRALLDRIYATYVTDAAESPAWGEVLEPQLAAAVEAEEGGPGADPFIDAQDYSPFRATYEGLQIRGDRAIATAAFTNFGTPMRIDYQMRRTPDGWRVFDVQGPNGGSLRERTMRPKP